MQMKILGKNEANAKQTGLCLQKNNYINKSNRNQAVVSSWFFKWTIAMLYSLADCIDHKDHKSEEEIKAIELDIKHWDYKQNDHVNTNV